MATVAQPTAPPQKLTYLKDFKPPDYFVDKVHLIFKLDDAGLDSTVRAESDVCPACAAGTPLELNAEALQITPDAINIEGKPVAYGLEKITWKLTVPEVPNGPFKLNAECKVVPAKNTELSGLYMSDGCFVTQ